MALVLWVCATALPATAQPSTLQPLGGSIADRGAPGYRFESLRVESSAGAHAYRVRIALPTVSVPPGGFPVAYLLDGSAALAEVDAVLFEALARSPRPPVIAFISHDNALRIDADARAFDYTPRRPGDEHAQNDVIAGRRNGGAEAFLALIEQQIVPRVEAMARIDGTRRALWGHSYGGVFVLHTLFARPQAFSIYAPVDPSLWWGGGQLLQEQVQAKPAAMAALWLMTGDATGAEQRTPPAGRDPQAVEAMRRARQAVPANAAQLLVEREKARGLHADHLVLAGLSHGQTLGASLPVLLQRLAGTEPVP